MQVKTYDFAGWKIDLPDTFGLPQSAMHQFDLAPEQGAIILKEAALDEQEYEQACAEGREPGDIDLLASLGHPRLEATLGPGMSGPFETQREDYQQRDGITTSYLHLTQDREGRQHHWIYAGAVRHLASYVITAVGQQDISQWVNPMAENVELYPAASNEYPDCPLSIIDKPERNAQGSFSHEGGPPPLIQPIPRPAIRPENMPDPSIKDEADLGAWDGSPILRREVIKGLRLLRYHRQQFPLSPYLSEPAFNTQWQEVWQRAQSDRESSAGLLRSWGYQLALGKSWRNTSNTSAANLENGQRWVFSIIKLPGPVFHHGICGTVVALERKGFELVRDHCLSDELGAYYLAEFSGEHTFSLAMRMFDHDLITLWSMGEPGDVADMLAALGAIQPGEKPEQFVSFETELFQFDLADDWICPQPGQAHNLESHCSLIGGIFPHKIHYRLERVCNEYNDALLSLNAENGVKVELLERRNGQDMRFEMERMVHQLHIEDHTVVKKYTFFMKPDIHIFRGKTTMFHLEMAIPSDDREAEHLALYEELIRRAVAKKDQLHD